MRNSAGDPKISTNGKSWRHSLAGTFEVTNRFTGDIDRLTNLDLAWPAWGPGGRRIAATQIVRDNVTRLVLIDVRTHRVRAVGATGYVQGEPAWSPDGRLLVFDGDYYRDGLPGALRTITPRGRDEHVLFQGTRPVMSPAWSPDGRHIVFAQYGVAHPQAGSPLSRLLIIRADGTGRRMLLGGNVRAYKPAYTADGRWVVFQRGDHGTAWAIHHNGTGLHQISTVESSYPRPGF